MKTFSGVLCIGASLLIAQISAAQIVPVVKKVGTHITDGLPSDCAVLEDGTTIIVGEKHTNQAWHYGFVALLNADGSTRKEVIIDGKSEGNCTFKDILVEPGTGNFYVGGQTQLWTGKYATTPGFIYTKDVCLMKFDKAGNELWFKTVPLEDDQTFCGMGFTRQGNISVAFSHIKMPTLEDMTKTVNGATHIMLNFGDPDNPGIIQKEFTWEFSPNGAVLATYELHPPYEFRSEYSQYIAAGDGNFWYLVNGFKRKLTDPTGSYPHLFLLSETGEVLRDHLITGSTGLMLDDMMVLRNGNLLISIHMFGSGGEVEKSGAYLFCFDRQARLLWKRYYYSDFEQPHIQSVETPEGNIISVMYTPGNVAEFAGLPKSRCNMLVTKLTADGRDIWKKTILGLPHYQGNEAVAYYNHEVRMAVEGAVRPVNNTPPDHHAYYFSFKDFE